ncbi:MAG: asparagine synthase-related protein, partial [Thermoplasmata archaeon]
RIKKLNTFVAAFEAGSEDALLSEKLASELGLEHTVVEYGLKEMLDVLPEVIYHLESFDFALVRSAIPNYIVVREAAKHVRTLLSGEGGDELFAGYSYLENIPGNLNSELRKLLHTAHNNAFQRDDRMFAAHGVDCRVPFLHLPLVEFAFGIPSEYKIQNGVRKWILRRAIEKAGLPDYIVNREKRKFSDGAGSMFAIEEYVENQISDREFEIARKELRFVRNKEELFYYRIFCSHFDGMEHLVGITERPER